MKTKGRECTAKRSKPPRRTCEVELTERRTATGADGIRAPHGLTQLEYEVLSLPADERIVRQDRIHLLLDITPAEVGVILSRLGRLGLIDRERLLVRDPAPWVWLTHLGARAAHLPRRKVYEPRVGHLGHIEGVVRARIHYQRNHPNGLWVPEREIRVRQGGGRSRTADGLIEVPVRGQGMEVIALEVEMTTKGGGRLPKAMRRICEEQEFTEVHYLCSQRIKPEATKAKAELEDMEVKVDHLKILDLPDLAGIA
jgi:DNA-binding MarR family transcriptional regulator